MKSIASCSDDLAQAIISSADAETVDKMMNLFNIMQNGQEPKLTKINSR